jgi:hypothetical protein
VEKPAINKRRKIDDRKLPRGAYPGFSPSWLNRDRIRALETLALQSKAGSYLEVANVLQ